MGHIELDFPPTEIITERLLLKKTSVTNAYEIFTLIEKNRTRLREFLPWVDHTVTLEDETKFLQQCDELWDKKEIFSYGIFLLTNNHYIGNISLFAISKAHHRGEIGYWLGKEYEGQGYMIESVTAFEDVFFDLNFNRLEIRCDNTNIRSRNIPCILNYKLDGILRQNVYFNKKYVDIAIFSKLKEEI